MKLSRRFKGWEGSYHGEQSRRFRIRGMRVRRIVRV